MRLSPYFLFSKKNSHEFYIDWLSSIQLSNILSILFLIYEYGLFLIFIILFFHIFLENHSFFVKALTKYYFRYTLSTLSANLVQLQFKCFKGLFYFRSVIFNILSWNMKYIWVIYFYFMLPSLSRIFVRSTHKVSNYFKYNIGKS